MPTAGEVLRIGPFTGGLNLASDPASVADAELVECLNLELDIDGSLRSRPPFTADTAQGGAGFITNQIIGYATFSGVGYLFANMSSASIQRVRYSTDGITWVSMDASNKIAGAIVQFSGKVWVVATPGSATAGGSWDPVGGWVLDADIPRGSAAVVHKNRLYVVPGPTATTNESRLYFSDPAALGTWPASNFIDVSPGDGESLNDILVVADNLMLFKNNSTHVLAYDLNPADAILREINPVIGVLAPYNTVQYENVVYILSNDIVYEIVNYEFTPINIKVPFSVDSTLAPGATGRILKTNLSLYGDRLIIQYYSKTYVFGLRTRTWGEWRVTISASDLSPDTNYYHSLGPLYRLPNASATSDQYYAFRNFTNVAQTVIGLNENIDGTKTELSSDEFIGCKIKTKDFDMADPVHFKRLFWWSADLLTGYTIIGKAFVVQQEFAVTWSQLDTLTWDDLGTWDNLTSVPLGEQTVIDTDNSFVLNKTVKFRKGLRFRKINFEILIRTTGKNTDGPAKIFSLTSTMRTKQTVNKQVN